MKMIYKCKLCNLIFESRTLYNLHKKENHNTGDDCITCVLCNRTLNKLGFGFHTKKKHNISRKDYYDTYIKTEKEGICKKCGKPTTFVDITVGYLQYCSNSCSNSSDDVISKKKETCKLHYDCEFPYQSSEIMSKIQRTDLNYDGYNFDSGWELQYYIYLKDHNIKFKYHPGKIEYTVGDVIKTFHPDFYLIEKKQYVEIKGDYLLDLNKNIFNNMSPEKLECMTENCIIMCKKELKPVFDYIKNKYKLGGRKSFLKEFKNGNIK